MITYSRMIPLQYDTDILILGGGIAGVACALTCAKMDSRVMLIERASLLGGNATMGGVANFCGNTIGQGYAFDTIVSALEEFGAIQPVEKGKDTRVFNHVVLASLLPELLIRSGVKFLLHTSLVDAELSDRHIDHVIANGPSGLFAIKAKQFIDCTGDGFVAQRCGFATMKGGESGYQLPMSYMYFVKHVTPEQKRSEVAPGWFPEIRTTEQLPMTSIWPDGLNANAVKIKIPMFDSTDTESLTQAEVAARRKMMSVLDYHQRVENRNYALAHGSPVIGIREGYRIVGDYVLTVDDLRAGRSFDDTIAVGTFYLDGHKPDDDKRTYILDPDDLAVPPYDIPLRSIIAKDGENLLMAGRCLSADQLALSSARVMTTCSMMGAAAAAAASLAVRQDRDVRSVDVREIQSALLSQGAILDKEKVREAALF